MDENVFVAIGSNMGDRQGNIRKAVAEIRTLPGTTVTAVSPLYDTVPVGGPPQDNFLNAAIRLSCSTPPRELLSLLLEIETASFGRRRELHWGPRPIDLDLLFFGDLVIDEPPHLILPHPRMECRRFVLVPLADIAPDFVHPLLKKSIASLLQALPPGDDVVRTNLTVDIAQHR